jgi:hypothetical protein
MVSKRIIVFWSLLLLIAFELSLRSENVDAINPQLQEKLVELEESASASEMREIEFTEKRFFSFRKKPVEVEGVLRLWSDVGVSIAYPKKRTLLIADDLGVLIRKFRKDGSFRQKSFDVNKLDTIRLLKAAFEFDRVELERLFYLEWIEDKDRWSITMTPRDKDEQKIEVVTMIGRELIIERIDLIFSGKKKIVILPLEERSKSVFSEEEKVRYFRSSAD